jgi:hypothetical protein
VDNPLGADVCLEQVSGLSTYPPRKAYGGNPAPQLTISRLMCADPSASLGVRAGRRLRCFPSGVEGEGHMSDSECDISPA